MKVFERDNFKAVCGSATEWDSLKREFEGSGKVSILDLRTMKEAAGHALADLPEGWKVEPHPISGSTISEQDVDVFRREVRRHGRLIAVGTSETRGSLLMYTDQARIERVGLPREVDSLSEIAKESELKKWLDAYLARHKTTDTIGEY